MLKFTRFALFSVLTFALTFSLASCSDDDKEENGGGKEEVLTKPTVKKRPTVILVKEDGTEYPSTYKYNGKNQLEEHKNQWGVDKYLKINYKYDNKDRVVETFENDRTNFTIEYDEKGHPKVALREISPEGFLLKEYDSRTGELETSFSYDKYNNETISNFYSDKRTSVTTHEYYTDMFSPNLFLGIPAHCISNTELNFDMTGLHMIKSQIENGKKLFDYEILESKDNYPTKIKELYYNEEGKVEVETIYTITYEVIE